ncbi:MAG TPA: hypothetical protein ENH01_02065 [Nitrospirae bacterium]|nr:hypothetical protein [Nitrospirota bacterium]
MGTKKKIVSIPQAIVQRIRDDIQNDGIKIYKIDDLPKEFIGKDLLHPDVCSKCDTFVASVSGSHMEGREYMFIAGLRRDSQGDDQVTDLDPIGMIYDLSTESPAPSGIAIFHGNFEGRTDDVHSGTVSVNELKEKLIGGVMSFEEAPKRFINAMHFVAKKYRDNIDNH